MLVPIVFRSYASISFKVPDEKKRVIVPDLLSDLFHWIVAFKQAPPRMVDSFDPWGNIPLYSGVDVAKWFTKPCTLVPGYYARRMK